MKKQIKLNMMNYMIEIFPDKNLHYLATREEYNEIRDMKKPNHNGIVDEITKYQTRHHTKNCVKAITIISHSILPIKALAISFS